MRGSPWEADGIVQVGNVNCTEVVGARIKRQCSWAWCMSQQ